MVVAAMQRSSPRARAGLSKLPTSLLERLLFTKVWSSSINNTT